MLLYANAKAGPKAPDAWTGGEVVGKTNGHLGLGRRWNSGGVSVSDDFSVWAVDDGADNTSVRIKRDGTWSTLQLASETALNAVSVALSPDGLWLAVVDRNESPVSALSVYNWNGAKWSKTFTAPAVDGVSGYPLRLDRVAFQSNTELHVGGNANVRIFNYSSGAWRSTRNSYATYAVEPNGVSGLGPGYFAHTHNQNAGYVKIVNNRTFKDFTLRHPLGASGTRRVIGYSVSFSADDSTMFADHYDTVSTLEFGVYVCKRTEGTDNWAIVQKIVSPDATPLAVTCSKDGKRFATWPRNAANIPHRVYVKRGDTYVLEVTLPTGVAPGTSYYHNRSCAFSADGTKFLYAGADTGSVHAYDLGPVPA